MANILFVGGTGESGRNTEYVRNTAQHLLRLGIRDKALLQMVHALEGGEGLMAGSV